MVEVAGIEPEYSLVNSKPYTVWCPYRCPSVQVISSEFAYWNLLLPQQKEPKSRDEHIQDLLGY